MYFEAPESEMLLETLESIDMDDDTPIFITVHPKGTGGLVYNHQYMSAVVIDNAGYINFRGAFIIDERANEAFRKCKKDSRWAN